MYLPMRPYMGVCLYPGLEYLSLPHSPIGTRHPSTRFGTGGLQHLHIHGCILHSMCNVLQIPCTQFGSCTNTNSTPCWPSTLAATFCIPTDRPNYYYPAPAPNRIVCGLHGSSSQNIAKYVIEVLEMFHNKSSNCKKPFHLLFSGSAVQAIHSDIVDKYFSH
jgi:hypothetical protein